MNSFSHPTNMQNLVGWRMTKVPFHKLTFTSMSATCVFLESSAKTEVSASIYQDPRFVFRMAAVPANHGMKVNPKQKEKYKFKRDYWKVIMATTCKREHSLKSAEAPLSSYPWYLLDRHIRRSCRSKWEGAISDSPSCWHHFLHNLGTQHAHSHLVGPLHGPSHLWQGTKK